MSPHLSAPAGSHPSRPGGLRRHSPDTPPSGYECGPNPRVGVPPEHKSQTCVKFTVGNVEAPQTPSSQRCAKPPLPQRCFTAGQWKARAQGTIGESRALARRVLDLLSILSSRARTPKTAGLGCHQEPGPTPRSPGRDHRWDVGQMWGWNSQSGPQSRPSPPCAGCHGTMHVHQAPSGGHNPTFFTASQTSQIQTRKGTQITRATCACQPSPVSKPGSLLQV